MHAWFAQLALHASHVAGSVWVFLGSVLACGVWVVLGPVMQWHDLWHLFPTTILTWTTWFLVVTIQHTQMRQEEAMQAKLDTLIRALDKADNRLIGIEKCENETSAAENTE